jgi:hypothetical protein
MRDAWLTTLFAIAMDRYIERGVFSINDARQMRSRLEEIQLNAERYEWLRKHPFKKRLTERDLDAAIDYEMKIFKEKKP